MIANFKSITVILALIILGLAYSGPLPAYAHTDTSWTLTANRNYVDYNQAPKCDSTTTPNPGGDIDGDGICDHWEDGTHGPGLHIIFTSNGVTYTYDMTCTTDCPSQNHKDVYLELDWMTGHQPDPNVVPDVVNAFKNSPTTNPDGQTGIKLHIQNGETSTSGDIGIHKTLLPVANAIWSTNPGYFVLKQNKFGTQAERNTSDPNHSSYCTNGESAHDCLTAKRQVFHYMVFIHQIADTVPIDYTHSSGWAEIYGNDAVVSLGTFLNEVGTIDNQEASLMHELGHNLNLYHGGGTPPNLNAPEDDNCKPNYLSIMSWAYEFRDLNDQCRPLDYSRSNTTPVLTEGPGNTLKDSVLSSYRYPSPYSAPSWLTPIPQCFSTAAGTERPIYFSNPSGAKIISHTGGNVDWNGNGFSSSETYSQNLNRIDQCTSSTLSTLTGHNDWNGAGMTLVMTPSAKFISNDTGQGATETILLPNGNFSKVAYKIESMNGINYAVPINSLNTKIIDTKHGTNITIPGRSFNASMPKSDNTNLHTSIIDSSLLNTHGNSTISNFEPNEADSYTITLENGTLVRFNWVVENPGDGNNGELPPSCNSEGFDGSEVICSPHREITSDHVRQFHLNDLKDLKFLINNLRNVDYNNPTDMKSVEKSINNAINDIDFPSKVVQDLNLIKNVTNNSITNKAMQAEIAPLVQDNIDKFTVASISAKTQTPINTTIPEFGSLAGMIILPLLVAVVILSRKNDFHF